MESRLIWIDGKIVRDLDATVPVLSPTAQFGINVFEGLRGYYNASRSQIYVFRLDDHLERLEQSCKLAGLTPPFPPDRILEGIRAVVAANHYCGDIALRVTVFVGGEGSWFSSEPTGMFIAPVLKDRSDPTQMKGFAACTSTWTRISDRSLPPRVKLGANYINGRYAHLEAKRNGYDLPILMGEDGKVSEGAGSCLFMVRKGVLITPPLTSSILESITRTTLFELARERGFAVEAREIDRSELYICDEAFLCGSAAEVMALTSLDRMAIGTGNVGPITRQLLADYLAAASGMTESHRGWLTPVLDTEPEGSLR